MNLCDLLSESIPMLQIKDSVLEKRQNEHQNEVKKIIEKPDKIIPVEYGDRFIPRRYAFENLNSTINMNGYKPKKFDVIKNRNTQGYWRPHNFRIALQSTLGLQKEKLYQLADPLKVPNCFARLNILPPKVSFKRVSENHGEYDWPCNPRCRPFAFADSTHDLPGFSVNSHFHIIAWSARGQITASFGHDLVMWTPNTSKTIVYKIKNTKAICYNPKGDTLAIGCESFGLPVIELWDVSRHKVLHHTSRHILNSNEKQIRCIEWDPSGKFLVCGTSSGCIYIFSVPTFDKIEKLQEHKISIHNIKFSPKAKYLAASDIEGNIFVWYWDSCKLHVNLISPRKIIAIITWHPWNGVDLIISEKIPASIIILHVPSKEIVGFYQRKDYICSINAIAFNKISAELVVSYTIKNDDGCISCEILVMASLDRIVDILKVDEETVKFLLWSPDGMQLATVADDDTLTIWNFFAIRHRRFARKENDLKLSKASISIFDMYNSIK